MRRSLPESGPLGGTDWGHVTETGGMSRRHPRRLTAAASLRRLRAAPDARQSSSRRRAALARQPSATSRHARARPGARLHRPRSIKSASCACARCVRRCSARGTGCAGPLPDRSGAMAQRVRRESCESSSEVRMNTRTRPSRRRKVPPNVPHSLQFAIAPASYFSAASPLKGGRVTHAK